MSGAAGTPRLGVVLVNWNRWADTAECLESLWRSTVPLRIVVVDNASADDSRAQLAAWARGAVTVAPAAAAMARFSQPPVAKPIAFAEAGATDAGPPAARLTLVDAGRNRGFAGGNNLGLRLLFADAAIDYVWLLNNDTVVEPTAAAALLATMDATHRVGMCGTVVRYYHRPDRLQCLNGSRFNPWTGNSVGIGMDEPASRAVDASSVAAETDFVLGASLAVSRRFVATVGPMAEDYFLYYEEIDWAYRNRDRFPTAFARAATVFHKEGGSIGSSGVPGGRSAMSEYHLLRARLMFVRRHLPWLLPLHWLLALALTGRRLLRRQPAKAKVMLQALFGRPFTP